MERLPPTGASEWTVALLHVASPNQRALPLILLILSISSGCSPREAVRPLSDFKTSIPRWLSLFCERCSLCCSRWIGLAGDCRLSARVAPPYRSVVAVGTSQQAGITPIRSYASSAKGRCAAATSCLPLSPTAYCGCSHPQRLTSFVVQ